MRRNIYVNGEKIARDDEVQMPTLHTMGLTFDYAADPKNEGQISSHRGENQSVLSYPSE
jgi:hypothetical protein